MNASVSQVLNKAADLLEEQGAWIRHELARSAPRGVVVAPIDDIAKCWCAEGAIQRAAAFSGDSGRTVSAMVALRQVIGTDFIHEWNDKRGRTQAEVVAALRTAASQTGESA